MKQTIQQLRKNACYVATLMQLVCVYAFAKLIKFVRFLLGKKFGVLVKGVFFR